MSRSGPSGTTAAVAPGSRRRAAPGVPSVIACQDATSVAMPRSYRSRSVATAMASSARGRGGVTGCDPAAGSSRREDATAPAAGEARHRAPPAPPTDPAGLGPAMALTAGGEPGAGEEARGTAWPLATGRVPLLYWLRRYERPWLGRDLAAAAAVTALIVPKNLGYAEIAGIPVQNGLYAAAAGAILYAIFCTSRHISTGPSSSLAAVAGCAVAVSGIDGAQAPELVAAIAIGAGLLFLVLAVLKLGWIARFLSRPVVVGFLAGAAIQVVIGELPKLT